MVATMSDSDATGPAAGAHAPSPDIDPDAARIKLEFNELIALFANRIDRLTHEVAGLRAHFESLGTDRLAP